MRSSIVLGCIQSAIVVVPLVVVACGTSDGGNSGSGFGGSSSGNSGNSGSGNSGSGNSGSGNSGSGNSGNSGQSGSQSGNSGSGGTGSNGGSTGASGSGTGNSGSGTGSTGASGGGTGSSTGATGATGSTGGATGSTGTSGTPLNDGGGVASACGTPGPNVLSDFEQDTGSLVPQGGRTGWWYVYADAVAGGTQTPASSSGAIAVGAAPSGDENLAGETCNKFALISTATGHTSYAGVGATFVPGTGSNKSAYSLASYDGIQFDIKGASASQPVFFEMIAEETQATTSGGLISTTDNNAQYIALNNNLGYYLAASGTSPTASTTVTDTAIPTAMTTVYVPFSLLYPRHFPEPGSATGDCGTDVCQAPAFVPAHALGFQFSIFPNNSANNAVLNNANGSYNLTIDNVALYTGDNGLNPASPTAASPTFNDGATGFASCKAAIPTFAGTRVAQGKYLQAAYANWKTRFVSGSPGSARKVIRPENGNDTVSEGIGYGMLLSVYFNDQSLFNDLWTYESANRAAGTLMTWNNTGGAGSATDADEDMAFALVEAGKKWSGTYAATAATVIGDIATHDIDFTTNLPKGGSNFATVNPTDPSYFAPAYYRIFSTIDTGHNWTSLANNTITVISALATAVGNGHGLVPAWCTTNCTAVGSNGAATDGDYQYDSHRIPWRMGVDYCWNGTASAKTFLAGLTSFFSGTYTSSGIDSIYDIYKLSGGADTTDSPAAQPNSMSSVGTAGVGAMAGGANAFTDAAWQFILDGGNRATLDVNTTTPANSSYSYFNATVGLLTALTMSGNFYPM